MKTITPLRIALLTWALSFLSASAHQHFAAGIVDTNQNGQPDAGEPLQFVGADGSDRTFHLLARPVGQRCGGHYMLDESPRTLFPADAFSLTVQSDGQYEIEGSHHAHTGAWVWVEIVSVSGPGDSTTPAREETYTYLGSTSVLETITDAEGHVTEFTYGAEQRVTSIIYADSSVATLSS